MGSHKTLLFKKPKFKNSFVFLMIIPCLLSVILVWKSDVWILSKLVMKHGNEFKHEFDIIRVKSFIYLCQNKFPSPDNILKLHINLGCSIRLIILHVRIKNQSELRRCFKIFVYASAIYNFHSPLLVKILPTRPSELDILPTRPS